jgi:hypothetical protein
MTKRDSSDCKYVQITIIIITIIMRIRIRIIWLSLASGMERALQSDSSRDCALGTDVGACPPCAVFPPRQDAWAVTGPETADDEVNS